MNEIIKMYDPDAGIDKSLQHNLKQVYDYRYSVNEESISSALQYQQQSFISDEAKWLHP